MKIIKWMMILVVGVVGLVLLITALLPSHFRVERSIVISAPDSVVFRNVADFNQWLEWNPWKDIDPTLTNRITGSPGEAGQKWHWEGTEAGSGYMELLEVSPYNSLTARLVFTRPQQMESMIYWTFEKGPSGIRVTWANEGELDYPIGRFFGLFVDKMMGPDFERGLATLKERCEQ